MNDMCNNCICLNEDCKGSQETVWTGCVFKKTEKEIVRTYRTKQETIEYFKLLSYEFEKEAHRKKDMISQGKAEAYKLAAFELEKNML